MNAIERLRTLWERLSVSLWFVPGVIVLGASVLALGMVELSSAIDEKSLRHFPRVFGASAESSRSMLATIAGSIVTVAGVTFSIMVVAVSQASTQYTPRVLRNFMRDRSSQVTLGILIGVFVYCLLVLRTIRTGDDPFVPSIAVVFAIASALLAVGLLMYFIHHIASTLEAGSIIATVAGETLDAIERLFPSELGSGSDEAVEASLTAHAASEWRAIPARHSGFIQRVDSQGLLRLAVQLGGIIRMERAVGEFVAAQTPLASVCTPSLPDDCIEHVNSLYVLATYRTVTQDPSFGIRQLVDIALKALSPGVNDATTAVTCIDYLAAVLVKVATRRLPERHRYHENHLRVIARRPSFAELLAEAFAEIRHAAADNRRILLSLLGALRLVACATASEQRHCIILQELDLLRGAFDDARIPPVHRNADVAACRELQQYLRDGRLSAAREPI